MNTTILTSPKFAGYASLVLRLGLSFSYLSAVADRFGIWGAFGQPNVEWGNFSRFLEYTHTLNWYLPASMTLPLGLFATVTEVILGVLLLLGWRTRMSAVLSALLLLVFAASMTFALGIKAPLNFSVLTGIGGSLLLASCKTYAFSVDQILTRGTVRVDPLA